MTLSFGDIAAEDDVSKLSLFTTFNAPDDAASCLDAMFIQVTAACSMYRLCYTARHSVFLIGTSSIYNRSR